MPIREWLGEGEIYHVVNRGAGKQPIFYDEADYLRFVLGLCLFNDTGDISPGMGAHYFSQFLKSNGDDSVLQKIDRDPMVELLAFALMPNHYHLLMRQNAENGISAFMKRLNSSHSQYINRKYERSGTLFEGRYKAVHVHTDAHLLHVPYYIHLNPLDLKFPEWRRRELNDKNSAQIFLESYRWSSYPDYIGKYNFSTVTDRKFLAEIVGGVGRYKQEMWGWINDMGDVTSPEFLE